MTNLEREQRQAEKKQKGYKTMESQSSNRRLERARVGELSDRQKEFLQALKNLRDSMTSVLKVWSGQEVPPDIGGQAYPFAMSFDEYPGAVDEWIEKAKIEMMQTGRACETCGENFTPQSDENKFCSKDCYRDHVDTAGQDAGHTEPEEHCHLCSTDKQSKETR